MRNNEKDTPGQRIADLCKDYGISQKELAEKIGLSASQLSRIISGKTPTINSDALIGIAETFKVSTDYILGLSSDLAHEKPEFRTFEELLLTDEEREERRKAKEEDKALADYYRNLFENPESYLAINENPEDDILEDDVYIWDEDI